MTIWTQTNPKSQTSSYIINGPCPKCRDNGKDRKGNNLATYSDGHQYCYACGYFVPASVEARLGRTTIIKSPDSYFHISSSIPDEPYQWLKKYGIKLNEINEFYFWDNRGYLVFDGGIWQSARNFGKGPKYLTKGPVKGNEIVLLNSLTSDTIVLVEDAVSALKVSYVENSCPIMGSVIPLELLQRLSKRFKLCYIWLDMDKAKESFTEASKAKLYFNEVRIIWADKDPKKYTEQEIKEKLK